MRRCMDDNEASILRLRQITSGSTPAALRPIKAGGGIFVGLVYCVVDVRPAKQLRYSRRLIMCQADNREGKRCPRTTLMTSAPRT